MAHIAGTTKRWQAEAAQRALENPNLTTVERQILEARAERLGREAGISWRETDEALGRPLPPTLGSRPRAISEGGGSESRG